MPSQVRRYTTMRLPVIVYGLVVLGALVSAWFRARWFGVFAVVAVVGILMISAWFEKLGVRVTESNQPALHAWVARIAASRGTPVPSRIWLIGTCEVSVAERGDLLIGRPLLACLNQWELGALIGHALAVRDQRPTRHVPLLLRRWALAVASVHWSSRPSDRDRRVIADLDELAQRVHGVADAAAMSTAGGGEVAARAFALTELAESAFRHYRYDSLMPRRRRFALRERVVSDHDTGWRRVLGHNVDRERWDAEWARLLALLHPGLAKPMEVLGAAPLTVGLARDQVAVAPLSQREERRLARLTLHLRSGQAVRWYTFETAPQRWWRERAKSEADEIRADVAQVLGRAPRDDVEVFHVLVDRNEEVVRAGLATTTHGRRILGLLDAAESDDAEQPSDPLAPFDAPPVTLSLVEDVLMERGWHLEHPAVRGVLISPSGVRIDASTLITGTLSNPDFAQIDAILAGH